MKNLKTDYFFDLKDFEHKKIFDSCEFVFEALLKIETYFKDKTFKIEVEIPPGVTLVNAEKITIGKGSVVEPNAYIKGPCIIGENCTIRHGAYIRGHVIVGNNCVIGHDTEVKNSIFFNDAHAAHFAYVGDSILGNHVNLGAGTKCANLKLNKGLINLYVNKVVLKTDLRKLGAIIGDGSQIGCNSVTNPGTFFGKNVFCYPCINVGGLIDSDSLIKPETNNCIKKYIPKP